MKYRWSLAENNILLDEVYDCGVALLVDSDSDCGSEEDRDNGSGNDREQVCFPVEIHRMFFFFIVLYELFL